MAQELTSNSSESERIVIAGAGPVGLFCAALLVEAGYAVTVLEQNSRLSEDMRASTFHPATLDLLDQVRLAKSLVESGTRARTWQYLIHGSDQRAVFDLDVISDVTRFPFRLQCEQFRLTRLIEQTYRDNPLFELLLEHELSSVQVMGRQVHVTVNSPTDEKRLASPWLIAADGGKSTVRRLFGLPFTGSVFPKTSITLVLKHPFEKDQPELLDVNYVWTERAHYSLMRIRDLWRFSYSPDQDQTVEEALSEPVAQATLQSVFPADHLYELLQRNYYTLHQRCLESFRTGRVLFAGDSAHLNSPSGGMGMNSGLHDAQCLIEHLVPVLGGESDKLLDRYSRRRRTIAIEEVQRLSAQNYRRHRETDPTRRREIWQDLQDTVNNRERMRAFLLDASMISARKREQEIA